VLEGVGKCFLDDPVGGHIEARREYGRFADRVHRDREPGLGNPRHELIEVSEPRLGREWGADLCVILAQHPEHAFHLTERLPPGFLDREDRFERPVGLALQQLFGGAGLDRHHADGVADRVVQFPRDPCALIADRDLLFAFQLCGLLPERPDAPATGREREANEPGNPDHDPDPDVVPRHDVALPVPAREPHRDEQAGEDDRETGNRAGPAFVGGDRPSDHDPEDERCHLVAQRDACRRLEDKQPRDDSRGRERTAAPPQHRRRHRQRRRHRDRLRSQVMTPDLRLRQQHEP